MAQHNAKQLLDAELEELCRQTGAQPEGIAALITYYIRNCGWTEQQAVDYIKGLFADGTIKELMMLR